MKVQQSLTKMNEAKYDICEKKQHSVLANGSNHISILGFRKLLAKCNPTELGEGDGDQSCNTHSYFLLQY